MNFEIPYFVTGGKDTVGLRMPNNETALKVIEANDGLLATTSANISGDTSGDFRKLENVDFIIDEGEIGSGLSSTIIEIDENDGSFKIIREGEVKF